MVIDRVEGALVVRYSSTPDGDTGKPRIHIFNRIHITHRSEECMTCNFNSARCAQISAQPWGTDTARRFAWGAWLRMRYVYLFCFRFAPAAATHLADMPRLLAPLTVWWTLPLGTASRLSTIELSRVVLSLESQSLLHEQMPYLASSTDAIVAPLSILKDSINAHVAGE